MIYSYFEISGHIYECQLHNTSIPSPQLSPALFRGAPISPTVAQVQAQRNTVGSGGPERAPPMTRVERHLANPDRWDSSPEKIRQARKEYGYGGKGGLPGFPGYFA